MLRQLRVRLRQRVLRRLQRAGGGALGRRVQVRHIDRIVAQRRDPRFDALGRREIEAVGVGEHEQAGVEAPAPGGVALELLERVVGPKADHARLAAVADLHGADGAR